MVIPLMENFRRLMIEALFFVALSMLFLGYAVWQPTVALAESSDWSPGYYRINPDRDRPFSNSTSDTFRSERSNAWNGGKSKQGSYRRELPDGFYPDTRRTSRPWGEIPPEWKNEDPDYRVPFRQERLPDYVDSPRRRYRAPRDSLTAPSYDDRYDPGYRDSYPYRPEDRHRLDDYYPPTYEERLRERRYPPRGYYDNGLDYLDAPREFVR